MCLYAFNETCATYSNTCSTSLALISMVEWMFQSVVRGYHVYKDTWNAVIGEELPCRGETSNRHDSFAVAIIKNNSVVGHVPRKSSAACSLFLRRCGTGSIICRITGGRQHSQDLPQGGPELPCVYIFKGDLNLIEKLKKVMIDRKPNKTGEMQQQGDHENSVVEESAAKKRKIDVDNILWVSVDNASLTAADKSLILDKSQELNDLHVFVAQRLLFRQFSSFNGLNTTLVYKRIGCWVNNYVQIMFCRGNHWTVVTTIECSIGEVCVYDSLYSEVDDETKQKVENIFQYPNLSFVSPAARRNKRLWSFCYSFHNISTSWSKL